jgi:CubicO group peptidase (beta-lactamase class C family)
MKGQISPRFARLGELLDRQLAEGAHLGVAVAVHHDGEPVVDAWGGLARPGGPPWERDTRVTVFSTTKGVTATCLHLLVERGQLELDAPVVRYWPGFARAGREQGKQRTTIRQLLSHQAGIPQTPDAVTRHEQTVDWEFMAGQMEELVPAFEPGTANAYHALNFGWLVGELVRRVSGRSLGRFFREEVAEPLGLDDVHVGLPEALEASVAPLEAPPPGDELGAAVPEDLRQPGGLMARTLLRPKGDLVAFMNTRPARAAELPASGGIATARGLARLYACLAAGGTLDGVRLLSPGTIAAAARSQTPPGRRDLVIGMPVDWASGYMRGGPLSACGPNPNAFGHAGYGGSVAFADPDARLGFAIVLNRMANELRAGLRVLQAVKAVYDALA